MVENQLIQLSCSVRRNWEPRGDDCHWDWTCSRENVSLESLTSATVILRVSSAVVVFDRAAVSRQCFRRDEGTEGDDGGGGDYRRGGCPLLHQETRRSEAGGGRKRRLRMPGRRKPQTSHHLEEERCATHHRIQVQITTTSDYYCCYYKI